MRGRLAACALGAIVAWSLLTAMALPFPWSLLFGWGGNMLIAWAWGRDNALLDEEEDTP